MDASLVPKYPEETEFNLREWCLKSRISHEITCSRRFSSSYVRSFREDGKSFRSNFTISSAASSPGYPLKDEIDPSTYSFTTALKALQARSGYVWDCPSPDGLTLNSKWSEAERYICNPLSGEVPLECLSSKTLSCRSYHSLITRRITMSAPLVYSRRINAMPSPVMKQREQNEIFVAQGLLDFMSTGRKVSRWSIVYETHKECWTRDVGIQSDTLPDESSHSPSPTYTPSIRDGLLKFYSAVDGGASTSNAKVHSNEEIWSSKKFENQEPKSDNVKLEDEIVHMEQMKEANEVKDTKRESEQQKNKNTEPRFSKYRQSCGYFPSISIPWCRCFIVRRKKKQSDEKE